MSLVDKFLENYSHTMIHAIKSHNLSLANFVLSQYWTEIRDNCMAMEIEELKTCVYMHKKGIELIEDIWEILAKKGEDYKIK